MSLHPSDLLSVGEMARRTGVPVSALHYYESMGLISSHRSSGNQRRYERHMTRRVSLILVAKRLGIPLSDVQEAFAPLPHDRMPSASDWRQVSPCWRRTLQEPRRDRPSVV